MSISIPSDHYENILLGAKEEVPSGTYVIFGATGDLVSQHAMRDALVYCASNKILDPERHHVVLTSRREVSAAKFLKDFKEKGTPLKDGELEAVAKLAHLDGDNAKLTLADMEKPDQLKADLEETVIEDNAVFYAALPPDTFPGLIKALEATNLLNEKSGHRLVLEKPFGKDYQEAKELAALLEKTLRPDQVYLVDHFLGYPGMLNWLSFRAHPLFDEALHSHHVESVEVKLYEQLLSNDRPYFRSTGILEDMLQNHAMQILACTALELPETDCDEGWHKARLQIVEAIRLEDGSIFRGQVAEFNDPKHGSPADAKPSSVETYATCAFTLDRPNWKGVPFRISAAKGVAQKRFGVDIHLNSLPEKLAATLGWKSDTKAVLEVDVRPGKIVLKAANGKTKEFPVDDRIPQLPPYSRLMTDALEQKRSLFVAPAESLAAWKVIDAIMESWKNDKSELFKYPTGADGDKLPRPTRKEAK